ncbi:uncharacterized protein F4822DRAFT_427112 [Hypoxylon trugodes]|uniref:uncharacterized protein n=1 Tax=Hypoxylon trugodes TaxID=326681 RepID=UPI00219F74EA|nr:uncharacterized protein F4822DRAFT_427112 [Hypoxylon trugodes]KAI1391263.1 hypothetical protein F4822DRAFT_427112 [Hypoxylon trugodes]
MTPDLSEKNLLGEKVTSTSTESSCLRYRMVKNMPSARHFLLTLFFGILVTAGLANAVLKQQPPSGENSAEGEINLAVHRDDSTFSRLLNSASPQALHEFLHAYFPSTYRHGVYDSDHSAMEAVHSNDPELATSIVQMAKRQQSGNDTTSATSSTSSDASIVTSTSETSTTQETSSQDTTSVPPTSSTDTTTSETTSTTSTETESSTTSTSESTQGMSSSGTSVDSSTDMPLVTTTTAITTLPSSTSSLPSTLTSSPHSSRGSTLTTTSTSSASTTRPTQTSTFVSTLPGGAKTTITSVEVVTPGAAEGASTTADSSGSLQSGIAVALARKPVVEVIIGAVVGGVLLV